MNKLIIPISDLKSYARIVKKQNPNVAVKRTDILNRIARTLGFDSYSNYERYLNKSITNLGHSKPFGLLSSDTCPLNELFDWSESIADDLAKIADLELPTIWVFSKEIPSTPLDKYILRQVDNVDKLPALRISGILYLLSLCSGRDLFDAKTWSVNWPNLLECLKNDALPSVINQRLEKFRVLNDEKGLRYHEGLLDVIEADLIMGTTKDNEAIDEIDSLLNQERDYISKVTLGRSLDNIKLSFPLYYDGPLNSECSANLAIIREHTSVQKPLLLGLEYKSPKIKVLGWPAKPKHLTLTTESIRDNIMITGAAGSGRDLNNLFLLRQAVMNNHGAIYIDGQGNPGTFWVLKGILKEHNRENDLTVLTIHHQDEFRLLDLTILAIQKKIVYVMLPALEKDPDVLGEYVSDLLKHLANSLPDHGGALKSGYFPFCLLLNGIMSSLREKPRQDVLCHFIDKANKHKLSVIASEQDYASSSAPMDRIVSRFKSHILMKTECPEESIFGLSPVESRELVSLKPGNFKYFRYSGERDPTTYRAPYLDPLDLNHSYLVMS